VTTVVVMAKAPVAGRVKTRLCPPCTAEDAARVAEAALVDTLASVADAACDRRVIALDGEPGPWLPPGFLVIPQVDGDLGDRLAAVVDGLEGPVLVVGMDTPQVTRALLDHACGRLLDPAIDAVVGPALDGGYWAIGFRDRRRGAFCGVEMSVETTAAQQRARLHTLGLRVHDLPRLRDVDTFVDALAVGAAIPHSRFARALAGLEIAA
jgi:rSAM/selenodomain-associated transferase 1